MRPNGSGVRRLTTGGTDSDAAWSPDGSTIAFTSNRDGNNEIYVMKPDASEQTNISNSPGSDGGAAWSPNGQSIAFTSTRRGGAEAVYVMDADGSHVRRIAKGMEPTWSSDGKRIAFTSDLTSHSDIDVVSAAGGGVKKLTKTRFAEFSPAWAPSKRR